MNPLVSIIIPTYNRCHLIGSTLDSIIDQSYLNWECIVVDDGSTDQTEELLHFYLEKDSRIKFHYRPGERKKGANACRNIGYELSQGKYVQWFDSDDLMVPEFLEVKVKVIEENDADFVISKTINFKDPYPDEIINRNEQYYQFDNTEISNYNYVTQKINWLSPDFLGKRSLVGKVRFNESLSSSQEYNFFCKLTCFSENAYVLNEFLTKRRVHEDSVQVVIRKDELKRYKADLEFYFETWLDLRNIAEQNSIDFLFCQLIKRTMKNKVQWKIIKTVIREFIARNQSYIAVNYLLYQTVNRSFNRGNVFRRKFIRSYNAIYPEYLL